jgi:hypothetical protein
MPNILATLTRVAGIERKIWAGGLPFAGFAKGWVRSSHFVFSEFDGWRGGKLEERLGCRVLCFTKGLSFAFSSGRGWPFDPRLLTSAHSRPKQKAFVLHADLTENHLNTAHNASPATPHLGHPADNNCVFVSCFLFMRTQWPSHR